MSSVRSAAARGRGGAAADLWTNDYRYGSWISIGWTSPVLRDASTSDVEGLTALHLEITRVAYRGLFPADRHPPSEDDLRSKWQAILTAADDEVVVADADGIVGSVALRRERHGAEVKRLHVQPSRWRRGVGSLLLAEIVRRARARELARLNLWVIDTNVRARRFFESAGWALVPDSGVYHARQGIAEVRYTTSNY